MEVLAFVLSLTALIISLLSTRKTSHPVQVDVHVTEQPVKIVEVIRVLESKTEETLTEQEPVYVSNGGRSQSAWKNQTGIPINETKYAPSPGKKPPTTGPLERPTGFTR